LHAYPYAPTAATSFAYAAETPNMRVGTVGWGKRANPNTPTRAMHTPAIAVVRCSVFGLVAGHERGKGKKGAAAGKRGRQHTTAKPWRAGLAATKQE